MDKKSVTHFGTQSPIINKSIASRKTKESGADTVDYLSRWNPSLVAAPLRSMRNSLLGKYNRAIVLVLDDIEDSIKLFEGAVVWGGEV